jgi:hypothetical protein
MKQASYWVLSHLLTATIVWLACYYHTTPNTPTTHTPHVRTDEGQTDIYTDYTPEDYHENYGIDLKQDGYLIKDSEGEIYYVPHFDLEDWFLRMNL